MQRELRQTSTRSLLGLIFRIAIDLLRIGIAGFSFCHRNRVTLTEPSAQVDLSATRRTERSAMRPLVIKDRFANRTSFVGHHRPKGENTQSFFLLFDFESGLGVDSVLASDFAAGAAASPDLPADSLVPPSVDFLSASARFLYPSLR